MTETETESGTETKPAAWSPPAGEAMRERFGAIRQIERRRFFHVEFVVSAAAMCALLAIWAVTEYHAAGGWPSNGFDQGSGLHVWSDWILYPLLAWSMWIGIRAWQVHGHRPPTEYEIRRELARRQRG